MGIENFFNTINRHTIFENNISSSSTNEPIKNITEGEHIYFDFNSIIYNLIQEIESELNYVLFEIITGHNTEDKNKFLNKYLTILEKTNLETINLDRFKEIFNSENIFSILMKQIKNKLIEILTVYNKAELIKNVFIGIDGTPNMPKIVEQKKRRYIQYVIGEMKKRIMNRFDTSFDDNRKLYESNKIYVERTNINAYTSFVKYIYDFLSNDEFKKTIYELLPNLQSFKISSSQEMGEGEKKIMEEIKENLYDGSYVIISPDADLIILCLIQKNMLNKKNISNKFQIIRPNQIKETIDVIDIDCLLSSILNFILKRIKESMIKEFEVNPTRIIDDICLLLTLFGNDFLPRLRSLNVRNGFNVIFEVYIRHLTRTRNRYRYITFEEDGIYKINYDNLNSFLYKISENEHKLCIETYASKHYKNYSYINSCLESTFGSPYFFDKINAYVHGFNKLMTHILANKNNEEVTGESVYTNLLLLYTDSTVFISELLSFEANISKINQEENKIKCIELLNKIILEIKTFGFYRNKLRFQPYSHTINDKYHQKILKENMIHPAMVITEYDQHIYKLEHKLDEYYHIFNSEIDNQLGSIDISNRNSFYRITYDNQIDKNKDIYYEEKLKITNVLEKNKLAHAYLTGMFWTFDHYFNKNNKNDNMKYISTWSYDYDSSPFVKDLIGYMEHSTNRNKLLNHIYYSVSNYNSIYFVQQSQFMNDLEQYIYITPYEKIKDKVPEKYLEKLKSVDYFINLENIISDVVDGRADIHIDCGKSNYLNKCTLIGMKKVSCNDYMKYVIDLREK